MLLTLLLPLYTRLSKKDVEDQETRGIIRGAILTEPGITFGEMHMRLTIPKATLHYHLRVLEREELVKSYVDGRTKRYCPAEDMSRFRSDGLSGKEREIVNLLMEHGEMGQKELVSHTGLSRPAICYYMDKFKLQGLVTTRKVGRQRLYVLNESSVTSRQVEEAEVAWE